MFGESSLRRIKNTPSLIPLFLSMAIGCGIAILYPLRCALKSPDVSWSKARNPDPWKDYANSNYKFFQFRKAEETSQHA